MASDSETTPKTLPRGEAPNPTQLSLRPVLPNGRSSSGFAAIIDVECEKGSGLLNLIVMWIG